MFVRDTFAFVLLATALTAAPARAPRELTRTFPVQPGCTLKVDTYRGVVTVEEIEAPEVRVTVAFDIDAVSDARAERMRQEVRLELAEKDNTVSIVARNPRESGLRFVWNADERLDLVYRIGVPRKCNVELNAVNGVFTVGNLSGRMTARLENGNITYRQIDGAIDARTDFGDIVVSRCSGALTARVIRGTIRAGTVGGPADLKTSNGEIDVMVAKTAVTASSEVGDVIVGFAPSLSAPSRISVSGGNILARIHPDTACRLDVSAMWGHVKCPLPVAVEAGGSGRRKLVGTLNGGGPLITLRGSGGAVTFSSDVVLLDDLAAVSGGASSVASVEKARSALPPPPTHDPAGTARR